jgi:hypothetical protein
VEDWSAHQRGVVAVVVANQARGEALPHRGRGGLHVGGGRLHVEGGGGGFHIRGSFVLYFPCSRSGRGALIVAWLCSSSGTVDA